MGWWTFDAKDINWTTNTALDRSGYGNNGTLTNMATKTAPFPGRMNQGLKFDNVNDEIKVSQSASINNLSAVTISAWMRPLSIGMTANGTILSKTTYQVTMAPFTNKLYFRQMFTTSDGAWYTNSNVFPLNSWTHVVLTYSNASTANDPIFYINGVATASIEVLTPSGTRWSDSALPITIGSMNVAGFFDGTLDDVRIYNRILTAAEAAQLYKQGQVTVNSFTCGQSTVKDADGNVYNTLKIDTQCWMKQNMRVGTMVTAATTQTDNSIIEKHCYSNTLANCMTNNNPNYPDGGLYQWNEAMQYSTTPGARGICPAGWHIPTHDEWTTLERAVCTSGSCATDFPYDTTTTGYRGTTEGTKLKPNGTSLFEGNLGGGMISGSFTARGTGGFFWSSVESGGSAWIRDLESIFASIGRATSNKSIGSSVRCLQN